jgi:hypothetical protein
VELVEAGIVGHPADPLDLGFEAVPRRRDGLAGIHLEILRTGIDVVAEFRKERLVGGLGGKDATWDKDDREGVVSCYGIAASSETFA